MTPEQFKELRSNNNLSQNVLAEMLGVQQSRISEWEKGTLTVPPYIEKFIRCLQSAGKLKGEIKC
jgi:DNA-binding transcriptional regulator YiaG